MSSKLIKGGENKNESNNKNSKHEFRV